jgi:hypothetical protein
MQFIHSLQSEWLKTKGSAASWLCLIGGFFLPLIYLSGFIKNQGSINDFAPDINVWQAYFSNIMKFLVAILLPMGAVLASSLIAQLEFRNNTWKQVCTTPQSYSTIYFTKLTAIFLMALKFFIFFNIGMILSAAIPCLLFDHRLPRDPVPFAFLLKTNAKILITCLPVISIQYVISLRFRNFLVPIGFGLMAWLGSFILINNWKYAYLSPYSHMPMLVSSGKEVLEQINIFALSAVYFAATTCVGYILFCMQKERG